MKRVSSARFLLGIGLLVAIGLFAGCATGRSGITNSEGIVTGNVSGLDASSVLIRGSGVEIEVQPGPDGEFSARLPVGNYKVFLKSSDGNITIVRSDIIIEENLTIRILDVAMVPIPVISSVGVAMVTHDSAIIEWTTNIDSDGGIEYGTDQNYGYSSTTVTTLQKNHRIQLLDLRPATRYHFRVISGRHGIDISKSFSPDFSFTTTAFSSN